MSKDPNQIEINDLAPYLRENIEGFGSLQAIDKFSGGQSNPTYKLTTDTAQYVLRAKPPGELLKSAHQVDREYRVMKALENTDVPVPRMLHLSEDDSPIGRMFFVMEYLDGRILWDPALTELPEDANAERGAIYDSMNKALAALHSVDPESVGLGDFGVPGSYFERQTSRWSKQYHASEVDHVQDMHDLMAYLEAEMPEDDGVVSLVHGDYRLDNMAFAHNSAKILGILDWELSTLGHPLADLAYQCMQWRLPNAGSFRGLAGVDRKAIGLPTEDEYVANYCERRGIGKIDNWSFYVAFSFFRLGAILQGVYKRSLDGNASNPEKAKLYGAAVPVLASMAMHMVRENSNS
ncbi:MAG: phosphotransferase family protein [Rhizobiaceae bacterium]|nr:phosphotransferase family protein [Rhizobiaceae bacterium]